MNNEIIARILKNMDELVEHNSFLLKTVDVLSKEIIELRERVIDNESDIKELREKTLPIEKPKEPSLRVFPHPE